MGKKTPVTREGDWVMVVAEMDARGRVVIPATIREVAGLEAPGKVMITADGHEKLVRVRRAAE